MKTQATEAIVTANLAATNTKGARIEASCSRGSIILPYSSALDHADNHAAAAQALVDKIVAEDGSDSRPNPWAGPRVVGFCPIGYVHVLV